LDRLTTDAEKKTVWINQDGRRWTYPGTNGSGYESIIFRSVDQKIYMVGTNGSCESNTFRLDEHGCLQGSVCAAPAYYYRGRRENTVSLCPSERYIGQYLQLKFDPRAFHVKAVGEFTNNCWGPNGKFKLLIPTPEPDYQALALTVPCEWFSCKARVDQPCRSLSGDIVKPHKNRVRRAREVSQLKS